MQTKLTKNQVQCHKHASCSNEDYQFINLQKLSNVWAATCEGSNLTFRFQAVLFLCSHVDFDLECPKSYWKKNICW